VWNCSCPQNRRSFWKGLDKSIFLYYNDLSEESDYSEICISEGGFMAKKDERQSCSVPTNKGRSCCKVESVISVDERGQMVLPKEIRDRAKIGAGDKLAVLSWEKDGKICCISLIKAEDLAEMTKDLLGPMMKEMTTR